MTRRVDQQELIEVLKAAVALVCSEGFSAETEAEQELERVLLAGGWIQQIKVH